MTTPEQRAKRTEYMRKWRKEHPYKGRTPEQKAKAAKNMRLWRAKNLDRNHEIAREFEERWHKEHPEITTSYHNWWRKQSNPESVKRSQKQQIQKRKEARAANPEPFRVAERARIHKVAGIPEKTLHETFAAQHEGAVWMDHIRPDFYIPGEGFYEVKRALPHQLYIWRQQSEYFPGLYFMQDSGKTLRANGQLRRDLKTQIALSPRPLTVVVYHALTGEELTRQTFH